ncbi:hypothetical protein [Streptomyces fractus]|uniref:hypothetical protein n=1 Tax=Streptomyces fractus TaxID=641806 RepID=UPI003CED971C
MAGVVLGAVAVPALPAQAAPASVSRFSITNTETFTAPLEGCLPEDQQGTVTLTETSTGQMVKTAAGVITVHGQDAYDYRLTFPDGRYVQSGIDRDLFTSVVNPPHTVFNVVTQDRRTIYAADGTPVGKLSIHAGNHVTYDDLNGNQSPDPGEISVERDYFRLSCQ